MPGLDSGFMEITEASRLLGPALTKALEKRGYTSLTAVQEAVLDPALEGRDLRISSQTGSGKTIAIGLVLRDVATAVKAPKADGIARPNALVVAPTRELAKQVEAELSWLYAEAKAQVASVTGGASYRDEQRAFARGPSVLVGTPGRLLDHLRRGSIDPANVAAVVLDEADRMLDLGFRDDLEAILAMTPEEHRTHLVSATFAREVQALANSVQREHANVQGTPLGIANTDIEHVVHLVAPRERMNALINLLLVDPEAQTLVFARTRADVAHLADELHQAGFAVDSLSGEMDQAARNRALSAFKRGKLHVLVATDVAARGIDHQDITRVVQFEPPTDADTYTHRSGRTGRAGRKGVSAVLVAPSALQKLSALLRRAGVRFKVEPVPTAGSIAQAQDARLFEELTAEGAEELDARTADLVQRIEAAGQSARALARLIARTRTSSSIQPRDVTPLAATAGRDRLNGRVGDARGAAPGRAPNSRGPALGRGAGAQGVSFRVSYGERHGAEPRRLLAMLCRRGNIRGQDVGAIQILPEFSIVEVAPAVAESFASATSEPDPRDPRIWIRREQGGERVRRHVQTVNPVARKPKKPARA